MATVRETIYFTINGEFNRVELIDCGHFRWEVAFYKQHRLTNNFDFYRVDEHSGEDHARMNFERLKLSKQQAEIAQYAVGNYVFTISKGSGKGMHEPTFDVIKGYHVLGDVKRTQVDMTAEETIRYLANAANRHLTDLDPVC
jgi:hypothetical protein